MALSHRIAEPALLYKYLDCKGIKVLENGTLRGSIPKNLNDPFEFRPGVLPLTDQEILSSIAKQNVLIDWFREMKGIRTPQEDFRTYIRQHPEIILNDFHQTPNTSEEYFRNLWDARDNYRMLCFSLRNDGILLWSHYADHHRGFVLAFDKAMCDCDVQPDQRFAVEYKSTRPCAGNLLNVIRREKCEALQMIVRTKSVEWAYEEEYRFYFEQSESGDNYARFNPDSLCQVIFGSKCLPKLERRIRQILDDPKYKHVKKCRATLSNQQFKIEIANE
jgi:hypothetical protein